MDAKTIPELEAETEAARGKWLAVAERDQALKTARETLQDELNRTYEVYDWAARKLRKAKEAVIAESEAGDHAR